MVQAADGWIAVNLPRDWDRELVPAWIGCDVSRAIPGAAVIRAARERPGGSSSRMAGCSWAWRSPGSARSLADRPRRPLHRMAARRRCASTRPSEGGRSFGDVGRPALRRHPRRGRRGGDQDREPAADPMRLRLASPAFFERLNGAKDYADARLRRPGRSGAPARAIHGGRRTW